MIAYVIDRLVDEEKATIGIGDLSIQRGFGIFDFFRTVNYVPLFVDDYLDRFFRSAAILKLSPLPSRDEIRSILSKMIKLNGVPDAGYKIILTGGYSPDGFEPSKPNLVVVQLPLQLATDEQFEKGCRIILHEYLRDVPAAKSINYLMSIYLREDIMQAGVDDVLYHKDGNILEFPRSNVFVVTKDQKVITPAANVLHGITRKRVLKVASEKYKTEERAVSVEELTDAAEVFLTSSTKRVFPVVNINNKPVGDGKPGEITKSLLQLFLQEEKDYISSCTTA